VETGWVTSQQNVIFATRLPFSSVLAADGTAVTQLSPWRGVSYLLRPVSLAWQPLCLSAKA